LLAFWRGKNVLSEIGFGRYFVPFKGFSIGKILENPCGVNICSNWGGGGIRVATCVVEIWVCHNLEKLFS